MELRKINDLVNKLKAKVIDINNQIQLAATEVIKGIIQIDNVPAFSETKQIPGPGVLLKSNQIRVAHKTVHLSKIQLLVTFL